MLPLYSLIYAIALFFLFPLELRKRPGKVRRRWFREKFGSMDIPDFASGERRKPLIWVHAVSVGEVMAAAYFVRAFMQKHPEYGVVISTITDTGQNVARERLSGLAQVVYMPFDLGWALKRAVKHLKPSVFVNMETELWPNLFSALKKEGVPIVVMNGRISDRSFRRYMKIRPVMRKIVRNVALFCMQDEEYARRIIELGANNNNVLITGSFKFDIKVKDEYLLWTGALRSPVLIAGSTHPGEEDLIVSVYSGLREKHSDLTLVLAPRHPQRFDEVEDLLKKRGVPYARRSALDSAGDGSISGTVILLDSMGELSSVYRACDIAVMGGSFIEHGGQNPLEPAYWGIPVVCGPHMDNFPFIRNFYDKGAALEVDESTLPEALESLLSSPERRREMGGMARSLLLNNQGAVGKALKAVERYMRIV
jgi:3-deoxy-D-manno-octulosonic-acid transferase